MKKSKLKELVYIVAEHTRNKKKIKMVRTQEKGKYEGNEKFYIIKREDSNVGIFSCILTFLSHLKYAEEHSLIPFIDMKYFDNEYLYPEEIGKMNAWEFFFEQPNNLENVTLEQAYHSKKCRLSLGEFRKGYVPSDAFLKIMPAEDAKEIKSLFDRYIISKAKPSVVEYCVNESEKFFSAINDEKILGVLCRGSDYFAYTDEQRGARSKIVLVIDKVKEIMSKYHYNRIYMVTEDADIFAQFKSVFSEQILYIEDDRLSAGGDNILNGERWKNDKIDLRKKGLNYIFNMYMLSKCHGFIGTNTSATVFLPLYADYEYSFFFDLNNWQDGIEYENVIHEER